MLADAVDNPAGLSLSLVPLRAKDNLIRLVLHGKAVDSVANPRHIVGMRVAQCVLIGEAIGVRPVRITEQFHKAVGQRKRKDMPVDKLINSQWRRLHFNNSEFRIRELIFYHIRLSPVSIA